MENKDEIRLKTVRREDPHVLQIVDSAPRTALYNYDKDTDKWSKTDVQGTLMIYAREAPPHYMIIIINRLKKNNFMEPITSACDIQENLPFLLFRNNTGMIFGIWFSEVEYVSRISKVIHEKIQLNQPPVSVGVSVTGSIIGGGADIMNMLSMAHVAYEKKQELPDLAKSTDSPVLKPSPVKATDTNNPDVASFFAKVGSVPTLSASTGSLPVTSSNPPPSATNPVLQKLFQGAAAIGGQASVGASTCPVPIPMSGNNVPLTPHNTPKSPSVSGGPMSLQELEGKLKENLNITNKEEVQKPSLLSPQVFSKSLEKPNCIFSPSLDTPVPISQPNLLSSLTNLDSKPLNGPKDFFNTTHEPITPLTTDQLVQAFTILLKKQDFVQQLHEAYIQALNQSFKGC